MHSFPCRQTASLQGRTGSAICINLWSHLRVVHAKAKPGRIERLELYSINAVLMHAGSPVGIFIVLFTMSTGARFCWYPTITNRFVDNDICERPCPYANPVPTRMTNHRVTGSNIRPTASANALCAWPWHPRRPKGHWTAATKRHIYEMSL